jgi:hypothetical protein
MGRTFSKVRPVRAFKAFGFLYDSSSYQVIAIPRRVVTTVIVIFVWSCAFGIGTVVVKGMETTGMASSVTPRNEKVRAHLSITYMTTPSDQQSAGGPTYVASLRASAWIASGGR